MQNKMYLLIFYDFIIKIFADFSWVGNDRYLTSSDKAALNLLELMVAPSTQHAATLTDFPNAPDLNDAIVKLFSDFDVKETSHHLVISHLDLHICDDIHAKEKGNKNCYLKLFWFSLKFNAHSDIVFHMYE